MIDRKKAREITGFTRQQQTGNPDAWFRSASSFRAAAEILHENSERIPSDSRPFVLNAAYSIELLLKAILARKNIVIPDDKGGHDLKTLCKLANVKLSEKQNLTLELLTEDIVWAARYPSPRKDQQWDNYHDNVLEKHIVRESAGNVFSVLANTETFPSWENYVKIWDGCVAEFEAGP